LTKKKKEKIGIKEIKKYEFKKTSPKILSNRSF